MSAVAVIQLAGKQYVVKEGETIEVNKLEVKEGETLKVTDVLLANNGSDTQVGAPLVSGASVTLKAVDQFKGDKVKVFKYKSKSRYRKTQGHRQLLTKLTVESITLPKAS